MVGFLDPLLLATFSTCSIKNTMINTEANVRVSAPMLNARTGTVNDRLRGGHE